MSVRPLIAVLTLALLSCACGPEEEGPVAHHRFTVDLGGVPARVEITAPARARRDRPAVLLVPDSGATDMDHTLADLTGKTISQNFQDIAEHLAEEGFVVMRYDKRHVTAAGEFDHSKLLEMRTSDHLDDARTMLQTLRRDHLVDRRRIFIYGYGMGAVVAAQLALEDRDVRGLVFQGPIVNGYARSLREQVSRVVLPYLREHASDGKLDGEGLQSALAGSAGPVVQSWMGLLIEGSDARDPRPVSRFDPNRDGVIDLDQEVMPVVRLTLADGSPAVARFDLPPLIRSARRLTMPILILQGDNDSMALHTEAEALAEVLQRADHADFQLNRYEHLGHSLGEAPTRHEDGFLPIVSSPLADLSAWLDEHS